MYKTVKDSSTLREILDRAAGKTQAITPIVYCDKDIKRARSVLDRLLQNAAKVEVSTVHKITKEIEEA